MSKKILLKDKGNKDYHQTIIEDELVKFFKNTKLQHSVIIILFKGRRLPKYCIPMSRNPKPKINILLNNNLIKIYLSAIKKNHSVVDGAILVQTNYGMPILRGFSYRIYPPFLNRPRSKNMGSGYNSSFDFSGVKRVVCVYFINEIGIRKFINGKEIVLC